MTNSGNDLVPLNPLLGALSQRGLHQGQSDLGVSLRSRLPDPLVNPLNQNLWDWGLEICLSYTSLMGLVEISTVRIWHLAKKRWSQAVHSQCIHLSPLFLLQRCPCRIKQKWVLGICFLVCLIHAYSAHRTYENQREGNKRNLMPWIKLIGKAKHLITYLLLATKFWRKAL